jgi:hypothetical protein
MPALDSDSPYPFRRAGCENLVAYHSRNPERGLRRYGNPAWQHDGRSRSDENPGAISASVPDGRTRRPDILLYRGGILEIFKERSLSVSRFSSARQPSPAAFFYFLSTMYEPEASRPTKKAGELSISSGI